MRKIHMDLIALVIAIACYATFEYGVWSFEIGNVCYTRDQTGEQCKLLADLHLNEEK